MKSMWQMWTGLLPSETCDEIIATAATIPQHEAKVINAGVDRTIRRSEIKWIDNYNEDFVEVWAFMERKFQEANANAFGVDISFLKSLQFTTYNSNNIGHYDWHEDIVWDSNNVLDRKLSMVIQLTDPNDYEGGDLEFSLGESPNKEELKKRGTIIVFPSFVKHRVTPVTKGVRNSLVAWMEGPKWR